MIKFSKILELPVISISTGERLGTIHDIFFIPGSMKIIVFIIHIKRLITSEKGLPAEEIIKVGKNAVLIRDESKIVDINQLDIPDDAKSYRKDIAEIPVYTDSGLNVGYVQDAIFNFELGVLAEFEISDGIVQDLIEGRKKVPASESLHLEKGILILENKIISDIKHTGKGLKRLLSERK